MIGGITIGLLIFLALLGLHGHEQRIGRLERITQTLAEQHEVMRRS